MKRSNLWIVLLSVLFMMPVTLVGLWASFEKTVTIIEGPQRVQIKTLSGTVGSLLCEKNRTISALDEVSPNLKTPLEEGMIIVIKRYKPIKVIVNGVEKEVYCKNLTTREVLLKAGVVLTDQDKVNISLDRVVRPTEVIKVIQVRSQTVSEIKSIPFKTVVKSTMNLLPGERRIYQKGTVGKIKSVYAVQYEGGSVTEKKFVRREVISSPRDQIILKGKAPILVASRGSNKPFRYAHAYIMTATGYDLSFQSTGKTPDMRGYGITASGTKARVGTVAVDPNIIPLGTKLYIEYMDGSGGYGYAVAEDTGAAIKGYRLDLFFNTTQEALQFGRKQVRVYVLN